MTDATDNRAAKRAKRETCSHWNAEIRYPGWSRTVMAGQVHERTPMACPDCGAKWTVEKIVEPECSCDAGSGHDADWDPYCSVHGGLRA